MQRPDPQELELYALSSDARETAWSKTVRAVKRHPVAVLTQLTVCLTLAVVFAMAHTPTYTAEARLTIGRIDVTTYAIPGFVGASKDLAVAYSRSIKATGVTGPLARTMHMSPSQINAHLSASPIPDSPIIIVTATGGSADSAIKLANAAQSVLTAYVKDLNRQNPDSARLLQSYQSASLKLFRIAQARKRALLSPASQATLDDLNAQYAAAKLQVDTLSGLYRASQAGQAATDVLQVLSPATSASSDSESHLQRLLFVGLLAGLAAGIAVALRLERRALPA